MIYVVSNGNKITGGPETLHQIAFYLRKNGYDAEMIYFNPVSKKTPSRYEIYNVPVADRIVDSSDNILIVPESLTHILSKYNKIKKCIVWLSVDYYILSKPDTLIKWRMKENGWPFFLYPLAFIVLLKRNKIQFGRYKFNDKGKYIHTYNCEYVRKYITENGVDPQRTMYICGPLNDVFFKNTNNINIDEKENIILFNPSKGKVFTKKVMEYCKANKLDAQFVPLKDMTADEVSNWMKRAKIYIDFGEFPGPERIPREAVMMGCNIITSRNGGAGNDIDVPIPEFLKFDDDIENLEIIYKTLIKLLNSYRDYYHYYDDYRTKVLDQKKQLIENTNKLVKMFETNI